MVKPEHALAVKMNLDKIRHSLTVTEAFPTALEDRQWRPLKLFEDLGPVLCVPHLNRLEETARFPSIVGNFRVQDAFRPETISGFLPIRN